MKQTAQKNHGVHFVLANYSWAWACSGGWWVHTLRVHWGKPVFPLLVGINHRELLGKGQGFLLMGHSQCWNLCRSRVHQSCSVPCLFCIEL